MMQSVGPLPRLLILGSGLKPEWVQKFRRGAISDPGVLKICALRGWVDRVERGEVTP